MWPGLSLVNSVFSLARNASHQAVVVRIRRKVQIAFFTVLKAFAAYPMKGFGAAHNFFHAVSKNIGGEFGQFIALYLCFPCFQASNFFFKIAYSISLHLLFLSTGKSASLEMVQLGIDLGDCGDKLVVVGKALRGLE